MHEHPDEPAPEMTQAGISGKWWLALPPLTWPALIPAATASLCSEVLATPALEVVLFGVASLLLMLSYYSSVCLSLLFAFNPSKLVSNFICFSDFLNLMISGLSPEQYVCLP